MGANNNATRHVSYRPMRWEDLDTVAACFDRVWPQREGIAGTPLATLIARYLTLHCVEPITWSNVAETDDGVFAGVTLVRAVGAPALFAQAREEFERTRELIVADPRGAAVVDMLEQGFFPRERILEEDGGAGLSIPRDRPVYLICYTGETSDEFAQRLRKLGYEAYSLAGGFRSYVRWRFAQGV